MAEFELSREEVDAAKAVFTDLHALGREAYEAWWPAVVADTMSYIGPSPEASRMYWEEIGNPMETMTRAILATLAHWPDKLEEAWTAYRTADTASADALFPVHDEL